MSYESGFVFGLIAVAAALMASNRVRFDVVALLVVIALMLSGVLTVGEALSGFGNPVVIMVAGLLVVGEMLARTGVARAVGDWILKKGGTDESRLLILIMVGAALLGAVMSSTAVVAIFIPVVLRIAKETGLDASKMLLPMSYAALISGMLTLIATAPNLVVHEELVQAGYEGFGFFTFSPVGFAVLGVAVVYALLVAVRMLAKRTENVGPSDHQRTVHQIWGDFKTDQEIARDRERPVENRRIGQEIDDPSIDIAALARAQGVDAAGPIERFGDLGPALDHAIETVAGGKPYLLDVRVEDG